MNHSKCPKRFTYTLAISFSFHFILILITVLIFNNNVKAQGCIELPGGVVVNQNAGSGGSCDYSVDLCVDVPNSPRPKRIDYSINYDSNGDGNNDATQSYSFSPGGSVSPGTHCLSTMAPSEIFIANGIPCGTIYDASMIGYTNNSGGTGGSCASTAGTIDEFNGFTPAEGLPVELVSFFGSATDEVNKLYWITESEIDVNYFAIQRMGKEENDFIEIGRINSIGDSNYEKKYEWTDLSPLPSAYYRLHIVDLDGSSQYSKIEAISQNFKGLELKNIFPNPVTNNLNLEVTSEVKEIDISIFDFQGRLVQQQLILTYSNFNKILLDLNHLSEGLYLINISNGREEIQKKFIKK